MFLLLSMLLFLPRLLLCLGASLGTGRSTLLLHETNDFLLHEINDLRLRSREHVLQELAPESKRSVWSMMLPKQAHQTMHQAQSVCTRAALRQKVPVAGLRFSPLQAQIDSQHLIPHLAQALKQVALHQCCHAALRRHFYVVLVIR
jgi:hypothetical protein